MWIRCDINLFFLLGVLTFYCLMKHLDKEEFPSNKREVVATILLLVAIVASFIVGVITL